MSSKETILNIPNPPMSTANRPRPEFATDVDREMEELEEASDVEEEEEGIGEFDDGRTGKLTLAVLLQEGLIEAAEGVMSIDYLGQTFKGDLLQSGKIKSQETALVFNNPSAWAIYCKQIVNPAKKSGCGVGWASVKYRGRKMDYFKSLWIKMKAQKEANKNVQQNENANDNSHEDEENEEDGNIADGLTGDDLLLTRPAILRHCQLAPKHPLDNLTTLIEAETFQGQGKIQPFNVSISSSALLLIDLHSHLNLDCVCGYLAGQWDLTSHNLAITHVFPCLTDLKDPTAAEKTETRIYNEIYSQNLSLVGWYRSCPALRSLPSLKDTEAQLEYQMKLLGPNDASYSPCVGLLASPYTSGSSESDMLVYWVVPPPESCPLEYGKPLKMIYTMVTDPCLSQNVLSLIETMITYYKTHPRVVMFKEQYNSDTKYITKMGRTLLPKFPRDQDERLWKYIRVLILGSDDPDIEDPLMIQPPLANVVQPHNNGSGEVVNEEDEIDDDEENALNVTGPFSKQPTRPSSGPGAIPPASTEEVISLLLQQQAPLAPPAAHQNAKVNTSTTAAMDFSKSDSRFPDTFKR